MIKLFLNMMPIPSTRKKNTYSTFTRYCYQKGTLPKDIEKTIPRSTKHTWRKQLDIKTDNEGMALFEKETLDYIELSIRHENSITLISSLKEIIKAYQNIVRSAPNKKQLLINNKPFLLETIGSIKDKLGFQKSCSYLSITTHQYFAWKNNIDCTASLLKLCRKRFSTQLTDKDVNSIKLYMDNHDFLYLSRATIYWKIIRDGKTAFSKSTFYKYCRLLGYEKRQTSNKCKKNVEGIKSTKVAEILHTDITYVRTADGKMNYLSFVEDNFSKFILLGKVTQYADSFFIKANIEAVAKQYGLDGQHFKLIVDGGSENKGQLDIFLNELMPMVSKIIARIDIPFANNVVEALHKKFKNEFLQGKAFGNAHELSEALPGLIEKYNNQYHDSLFGYSPLEVWNGAMPAKESFKEVFQIAGEKRKAINNNFKCCALNQKNNVPISERFTVLCP